MHTGRGGPDRSGTRPGGEPDIGTGAGDDIALDAAREGVADGADVIGGRKGEAVGPARGTGLGEKGEAAAVGKMDVGDADVSGIADTGPGLGDGRRLDDIAHPERPQVAGDGGADARVGHDDHGGRLVRTVGDQACGLLKENGHKALLGWRDGGGSGDEAGTNRAFKVTDLFGIKPGRL